MRTSLFILALIATAHAHAHDSSPLPRPASGEFQARCENAARPHTCIAEQTAAFDVVRYLAQHSPRARSIYRDCMTRYPVPRDYRLVQACVGAHLKR